MPGFLPQNDPCRTTSDGNAINSPVTLVDEKRHPKSMREVQGAHLDWKYLNEWAEKTGVIQLLDKIRPP